MAKMVRKQIYIEPRQEATLKRMVRESNTTEAELIRQAIDQQVSGALYLPVIRAPGAGERVHSQFDPARPSA